MTASSSSAPQPIATAASPTPWARDGPWIASRRPMTATAYAWSSFAQSAARAQAQQSRLRPRRVQQRGETRVGPGELEDRRQRQQGREVQAQEVPAEEAAGQAAAVAEVPHQLLEERRVVRRHLEGGAPPQQAPRDQREGE